MTTTRIDHTGHNHPSTTAARTACRKAIKATPVTTKLALVGNGKFTHHPVMADDTLVGVSCGQGLQRGRRRASTYTLITVDGTVAPSCHKCH